MKNICDTLRNSVLPVQFKKREKCSWGNVTFSKINTSPWVYFMLNRAKHRSKSVASLEAYSKPCQT